MDKLWKIKGGFKPQDANFKIDEIIKNLLKNRNLKTKKQIDEFLTPQNPYTILPQKVGIEKKELVKAINRIKKAINNKENIIIYGDYDADGICATAIIWETLHALGAKVMPFIPNRENLGYGLKQEGIEEILGNKKYGSQPRLIITVDNGIVAHQGIEYANKVGIDVIVTDHHQKKICALRSKIKDKYDLPQAYAIIWSDQIAGSGVAWFLAKEIYQHFHKSLLGFKASNSLELSSIGTITDLMPVLSVNRSLIKHGFEELRKSRRWGIKALCQETAIFQEKIDSYEIGYIIGPRLNAMGRLEDALESLRLLCTKNAKKAEALASKLGLTNRQRQQLTETTFEHAKESLKPCLSGRQVKTPVSAEASAGRQNSKLIFISHESYNQGIIGLVAGRLVEEFYRPAIVISKGEEYSKGSVRSVNGFNIIEFLRSCEDCFEDLGGHPMAAGFTVATKKLTELENKLKRLAEKQLKKELLKPKIYADLEINLNQIDWSLVKKLDQFAPFGLGNPKPVFVSRNVKVVKYRTVGRNNQHLKLVLQSSIFRPKDDLGPRPMGPGPKSRAGNLQSLIFNAIAFGKGNLAKQLLTEKTIDICFTVEKNVWNGNEQLELKIKDIKLVKKNRTD